MPFHRSGENLTGSDVDGGPKACTKAPAASDCKALLISGGYGGTSFMSGVDDERDA